MARKLCPRAFPIAGDWNGDGVDTIAAFTVDGWHIRNSNTPGADDLYAFYGLSVYRPTPGDFDGNGTETVGMFVAYG